MNPPALTFSDHDPAAAVEAAFRRAQTRMAGLPVVNPALAVEAVGLRAWNGHWAGVLLTPWTLSLLLLPGPGEGFRVLRPGDRQSWGFPSGAYEFIGAEEDGLGRYQSCSLFSPVFEFACHADARDTALAIGDALFRAPAEAVQARERSQGREEARLAGRPAQPQPLSRRGFLGGGFLR